MCYFVSLFNFLGCDTRFNLFIHIQYKYQIIVVQIAAFGKMKTDHTLFHITFRFIDPVLFASVVINV